MPQANLEDITALPVMWGKDKPRSLMKMWRENATAESNPLRTCVSQRAALMLVSSPRTECRVASFGLRHVHSLYLIISMGCPATRAAAANLHFLQIGGIA